MSSDGGAGTTLGRRALGAGVAGVAASSVLLAAGCDVDEPLDLPGLPRIGEEPDHDRVVAGLNDERQVLDQVVRVRRRHRSLRRPLAATESVHAAHVDLLTGAVDDAEEPGPREVRRVPVPAQPAQALAQLVRLERSLSERHVDTALRSRSGVLARVVASMSAAAAQQAVVLASLDPGSTEPGSRAGEGGDR